MWKFKLDSVNQWLALTGGCLALIGAIYGFTQFISDKTKLDTEDFIGFYHGEAEGFEFEMGIELLGKNKIIGEINFGDPNFVEVQLTGTFNKDDETLNLKYRRNTDHLRGEDEGLAYLFFDKENKIYSGYWKSSQQAGNEQKWKLSKISNTYEVKSWNGGLEK